MQNIDKGDERALVRHNLMNPSPLAVERISVNAFAVRYGR